MIKEKNKKEKEIIFEHEIKAILKCFKQCDT